MARTHYDTMLLDIDSKMQRLQDKLNELKVLRDKLRNLGPDAFNESTSLTLQVDHLMSRLKSEIDKR